ncbi:septum formation family protein [Micromonospora phytophila]|uniref:septum formation family protein n=1 Tax=Micromonospora phytophila TaxID=709888 RepID=UPI0020306852|nr:septum formation family protein [Micromonospora phytophila]MCM0676454.1 septum formation family protein [Micromonospora phytophila]
MRRCLGVLLSAALVAAALTGCGTPPGTDGDLTDDWRPVAEPRQFAPQAGECHVIGEATAYLTSHQPVECAKTHLVETFHIGTFTGDLAARPIPPKVGTAAMRSAFAECDAEARKFVGGDWRGARLTVQVAPTSPAGWTGGSRWYRCDLFELDAVRGANGDNDAAVGRSGSLRGALKGSSPLALRCGEEDDWGHLLAADCTRPHRFEYAGIWTAPDTSYADAQENEDGVHAKCRAVIARYAKVPVDGMLRYRTGTTYRFPSEQAWARGDRGVRCWFWSGGKKLTRSIAGGGTKALPVN